MQQPQLPVLSTAIRPFYCDWLFQTVLPVALPYRCHPTGHEARPPHSLSSCHVCLLTNLLSSGYIIKRVIFFNFLGQHSLGTVQLGGGRIYLDAKQFRDFLMAFFLNDVQVEDCSVTIRQIPYHGMDDCWWNSLRVRFFIGYIHLLRPKFHKVQTAVALYEFQRFIQHDFCHPAFQRTIPSVFE